jgi:hypothetical protein
MRPRIVYLNNKNMMRGGIEMQHTLERIEELLNESAQIMDHLILDGSDQPTAEQLNEEIRQQLRTVSEMIRHGNAQEVSSAESVRQAVDNIRRQLGRLRAEIRDQYEQSTNNAIETYEAKAIEEQQENPEAYHDKIDYKSLVKVEENLSKAMEQLSQMA